MDESTAQQFSGGFAGSIHSDNDMTIREAGALAVVAGGAATMREAGAGLCVIGGDMTMSQSGAGNMLVGGSANLDEARVGQLLTLEANVADGRVGVLIAGKATLENTQVMLGTAQAAALGAVAGGVLFLLSRLFRRH